MNQEAGFRSPYRRLRTTTTPPTTGSRLWGEPDSGQEPRSPPCQAPSQVPLATGALVTLDFESSIRGLVAIDTNHPLKPVRLVGQAVGGLWEWGGRGDREYNQRTTGCTGWASGNELQITDPAFHQSRWTDCHRASGIPVTMSARENQRDLAEVLLKPGSGLPVGSVEHNSTCFLMLPMR